MNLLADLQAYHVFFFVDPNRANQTTLRDFFYVWLFGKNRRTPTQQLPEYYSSNKSSEVEIGRSPSNSVFFSFRVIFPLFMWEHPTWKHLFKCWTLYGLYSGLSYRRLVVPFQHQSTPRSPLGVWMENVMRWGEKQFEPLGSCFFFFWLNHCPFKGGVRRLGVIERNHLGWVFEGRNLYIWGIGVEVGWKWWVGWKETSQAIVLDQWRYFQPLFKGV